MSLTKTVGTEELNGEESKKMMIYSPKLRKVISLNSDEPMGEIQKYNVGLAPGTWY